VLKGQNFLVLLTVRFGEPSPHPDPCSRAPEQKKPQMIYSECIVGNEALTPKFLKDLGLCIRKSLFIAFDLEFTGLARKVDNIDSIEERYAKLSKAVQT
jgi:hypothetical protein